MKSIPMLSAIFIAITAHGQGVPLEMPKNHAGITTFAFLPDGKTVAGGTRSVTMSIDGKAEPPMGGEVVLWNMTTGRIHKTLGSHGGEDVSWVASSSDGSTLASISVDNGQAKIWDLKRAALRHTFKITGTLGTVPRRLDPLCAFSPDGKFLAVVTVTEQPNGTSKERTGDELSVWDVASGKALWKAKDTKAELLVFTPDSQSITTTSQKVEMEQTERGLRRKTSDEFLIAREVATGKERWRSPIKPLPNRLIIVPNRGILALGPKSLTFFDPATGAKTGELKAKLLPERAPAVSSDGKRLAAFEFMGRRIDWLDLGSGKVAASQKLEGSPSESAISPDLTKAIMDVGLKTQIVTLAPEPAP
jgi:WD40 repeat protein